MGTRPDKPGPKILSLGRIFRSDGRAWAAEKVRHINDLDFSDGSGVGLNLSRPGQCAQAILSRPIHFRVNFIFNILLKSAFLFDPTKKILINLISFLM
jgi:hypothetical protein